MHQPWETSFILVAFRARQCGIMASENSDGLDGNQYKNERQQASSACKSQLEEN